MSLLSGSPANAVSSGGMSSSGLPVPRGLRPTKMGLKDIARCQRFDGDVFLAFVGVRGCFSADRRIEFRMSEGGVSTEVPSGLCTRTYGTSRDSKLDA